MLHRVRVKKVNGSPYGVIQPRIFAASAVVE